MNSRHKYYVYILASRKHGTTYTGVTNDLLTRFEQHKTLGKGYAYKWGLDKLVYFQEYGYINDAIDFEKKIKNRGKAWRWALIEKMNPDWQDLSLSFEAWDF